MARLIAGLLASASFSAVVSVTAAVALLVAGSALSDDFGNNPFIEWDPAVYGGCGGDVPAFPGAEGYGAEKTCGGRGGQILLVTSLNDNGNDKRPIEGSLRAALAAHNAQDGPSIILFRVGGTILARAGFHVRKPNLTIAGQTAPGDGIMLRGPATDGYRDGCSDPECYGTRLEKDGRFTVLNISASNVIVRHLRVRPGLDPSWRCDDDRDNDGICWGDTAKTSDCRPAENAAYPTIRYDNCPQAQNGPRGGTCTAKGRPVEGSACQRDSDCRWGQRCSMNQEDSDGDGIGDACDANYDESRPDALDLRLYPRDDHPVCYNGSTNMDGLVVYHQHGSPRNVILDHLSVSWATDEVLAFWSQRGHKVSDIIVQYSIISEGLNEGHKEAAYLDSDGRQWGDHASGFLTSAQSENISYHHNVIAQHTERCPAANASGPHEAVNNVIVNCWGSYQNRRPDKQPIVANVSHNLFLPGFRRVWQPGDRWHERGPLFLSKSQDRRHYYLYLDDNIGPKRLHASQPQGALIEPWPSLQRQVTARPRSLPATPVSATTLGSYGPQTREFLSTLLADVGARPDRRDTVDQRLVAQVQATHDDCLAASQPKACVYDGVTDPNDRRYGYSPRYGGLIRNQDQPGLGGYPVLASGAAAADKDADGMPDAWERAHGLDPEDASDGPRDADGDIYTNVEEYLNATDPRSAQVASKRADSANGSSANGK